VSSSEIPKYKNDVTEKSKESHFQYLQKGRLPPNSFGIGNNEKCLVEKRKKIVIKISKTL